MDDDDVPFDAAVAMLHEREPGYVHTFRQALAEGGRTSVVIGAAWSRAQLIEAMRAAPAIRLSGDNAQALGHGLVIESNGWLFIETSDLARNGE